MHTVDMVYYWARTIPRHPAIIRPEEVVTYSALAQSVETATDNLSRAILDREQADRGRDRECHRHAGRVPRLMRAGFNIVPASKQLFEHLPQVGADTLVYQRGGDDV